MQERRWTRHLVYRAEVTRTTWKLRLGVVVFLLLALWLTSGWWIAAIGRSVTCDADVAPSDAILVESFDFDYPHFERAADLRRAGLARRVLVATPIDPATREPEAITVAETELMASRSGLGSVEYVPVRDVEPVTLNAARDVHRFLEQQHVRSVIAVTSLHRSRRSALVYAATLERAGITVHCQTVPAGVDARAWVRSRHGIEDVLEQWLKLQYYRLYVLPLYS